MILPAGLRYLEPGKMPLDEYFPHYFKLSNNISGQIRLVVV